MRFIVATLIVLTAATMLAVAHGQWLYSYERARGNLDDDLDDRPFYYLTPRLPPLSSKSERI